jgi:hypothetical protein
MRAIFFLLPCIVACSNASWTDTFTGTDTRSTGGGIAPLDDSGVVEDVEVPTDGGASTACDGLAASAATVPITVTFPGHGTATETVHIVAAGGSCDFPIDSDEDGVDFASDTYACAALLAVGTPIAGTATISGDNAPNDMFFQWSYGATCTINDDYSLSAK